MSTLSTLCKHSSGGELWGHASFASPMLASALTAALERRFGAPAQLDVFASAGVRLVQWLGSVDEVQQVWGEGRWRVKGGAVVLGARRLAPVQPPTTISPCAHQHSKTPTPIHCVCSKCVLNKRPQQARSPSVPPCRVCKPVGVL